MSRLSGLKTAVAAAALLVSANAHAVVVSLFTTPSAGEQYAPATVTVTAEAEASEDGERLTSVKIYRNGVQVATSGTYTASNLGAGTYRFYAVATSNIGTATSQTATISVIVQGGKAPTVSLGAPTGNPFIAPATIGLSATASDDLGVTKVEFLANGNVIGSDTTAPYQFSWSNVAAGTYTVAAKAYDGNSLATTSTTTSVVVDPSTIKGNIDTVVLDAGFYHVRGWACSTGMNQSIGVHLYADGAAGSGTFVGAYTANLASEPAIAASCYASGTAYRFSIPLSDAVRTAHANKKIYVYGISPVGQPNLLLDGSGVLSVPAPLAAKRRYIYDAHQRVCKTIEPETGISAMTYDAAGNLDWTASAQNSLNQADCSDIGNVPASARVYRTYDARNRLTSLAFPDGRGSTTYSYTPDGQLASLVADNGGADQVTTNYSYNKRRLLIGEWMLWGLIDWPLMHAYDKNGNLSRQTYPGSLVVDYAPNALGQPTQAGTYVTGVSYHPNGAIKQFTYGNGIVHTMTPNIRGLPDTSQDAYGATLFLNDGYDYDANGNVVAITDGATGQSQRGNRAMTYDGLDRVKTVTSPMYGATGANYAYDGLDNLIRVSIGGAAARDHYYCYDTAWRLTNIKTGSCSGTSVVGLQYDVRGNLSNKNGVTYNFDYGNRLRGIPGVASYVYDGHGRRVRDYTTAGKYSMYSKSGQLIYASDGRKNLRDWYVYLGGSLVAIYEWDVTPNVKYAKYQHTDALGSPVAVTDTSRTVLERFEYEPFGKVLRPLNPQDGPGYTGHVFDSATGLNYMQQRYYDPQVGRFLSVDPVAASSTRNFNRYSYAANNPYRFTDPDGRDCVAKDGKATCSVRVTESRIPVKFTVDAPGLKNGSYTQQSLRAHLYSYAQSHNKSDASVQRSVARDPTPAPNDKPASPQGTLNNASPGGLRGAAAKAGGIVFPLAIDGDSPVKSYTFVQDGNTWTVNVTQPGHALHFGYVLRGSVGGQIITVGEGWGLPQALPSFISDPAINDVWIEQNQRNINGAR